MKATWMLVRVLALHLALGGAAEAQRTAPPAVNYDQHVKAGGAPPPAGTLQNPTGVGATAGLTARSTIPFSMVGRGVCRPGAERFPRTRFGGWSLISNRSSR